MKKVNEQSIIYDTFLGLLTANLITVVVGVLWIYISTSLSVLFLIFACVGAGAWFMETRPRLTMSFLFIFIYAGFGIFTAEKYWVSAGGNKIETSVDKVMEYKDASQFKFTNGKFILDIYGLRRFCGRGGAERNVGRPCVNYFIFPYADERWTKNEPVKIWAVLKQEEVAKSGEGFKDPMFREAVLEVNDLYEETVKEVIKKNELINEKNFLILRFVKTAEETVKNRKRDTLLFFGIGSLSWIFLFPLFAFWNRRKNR